MLRPRGADEGGLEWRIASSRIFTTTPASPTITVGVKEFMCMGAKPPFDHPHIFIDMGGDKEAICSYCSTRFVYDPALGRTPSRPNANFTRRREPWRVARSSPAPASAD